MYIYLAVEEDEGYIWGKWDSAHILGHNKLLRQLFEPKFYMYIKYYFIQEYKATRRIFMCLGKNYFYTQESHGQKHFSIFHAH